MIRFPTNEHALDSTFIAIDGIPFIKHNQITERVGPQPGFLTEHTVFFILEGQKRFHLADKTITVDSSQLIFAKRGIYTISEQLSKKGAFEAVMIFIPDGVMKQIAYESKPSKIGSTEETDFLILDKEKALVHFQNQLVEYIDERPEQIEKLSALKQKELLWLLLSSQKKKIIMHWLSDGLIDSLADMEFTIRKYLFHPLTVADYARLCAKSVATFKRDFHKIFDSQAKKWINNQRLEYADKLLCTSDKTVAVIASNCGFESPSHFIKIFKDRFGVTPHAKRTNNTTA